MNSISDGLDNKKIKIILCIDGGSIRNLVSIHLLNKIKEYLNQDLTEICDLISSTSTGSIIVCAKSNKSNKIISNEKLIKQYELMAKNEHTIRFSASQTVNPNSSILNNQSNGNNNVLLHNSISSSTALKNSIIQFFNKNDIQLSIQPNSPSSSPVKQTQSQQPQFNYNNSIEPIKKGMVVCVCENKKNKERIAKVYTNFENISRINIKSKNSVLDFQRTNLPIESVFEQFQDINNVYYDSGTLYNSPVYFAFNEAKSLYPNSKLLIISIGSGYDIKSANNYQISNEETNKKVEQFLSSINDSTLSSLSTSSPRDFKNLYKYYESYINKENPFSLLNDFESIQNDQEYNNNGFIYRFDCPIDFNSKDYFNFNAGSTFSSYDGASSPSSQKHNELKESIELSINQDFQQSLFNIKKLLELN